MKQFDVLIIGAGPYGLSTASHLRARGMKTVVCGVPMSFWSGHMPQGMLLRSPSYATDLSDPDRTFGLRAYHDTSGPVPLEQFLRYGLWFKERTLPDVDPRQVQRIYKNDSFTITLEDGEKVAATQVAVAAGIGSFTYRPPQFQHLPNSLASHSSDHSSLTRFRSQRVAVVGAGQSALESAALLHEAGAEVELLARCPEIRWLREKGSAIFTTFERALWGPAGVGPAGVSKIVERPSWFRTLPRRVQDRYMTHRPAGASWLRPRLVDVAITTGRSVVSATRFGERVSLSLDDNSTRIVEHVLLATGFRVDIAKYPFLSPELLQAIARSYGYPKLSRSFESSVPGLYFLGAPAAWSYGPLMRFVAGAHFAAPMVAAGIAVRAARPRARVALSEASETISATLEHVS
jgi:cation diffusion facilitator CzcD-associated flavoprotein CzcO